MEEKLIQYIKGKHLPKKEIVEILDWIEASEANQQKYTELKNLWVLTGLSQVRPRQTEKFFSAKNQKRTIRMGQINSLLKYAAIVFLSFVTGAFSLYLISQKHQSPLADVYNEIKVPNGEKSMISLYDGTKVWLNSGTTLKYPVAFSSDHRSVFVEGEAYFEVAKTDKSPFIVHAGQMEIRVFGTKFNVYSYPSDDLLYTTLEEGRVSVSVAGLKEKFSLEPGDQFGFSRSSKTTKLEKVNTSLYTCWKENLLRIENASFSELLKRMERWYGVKIDVEQIEVFKKRYNMTIKTESLREILQLISLTTPVKYEIEGDKVFITKQ